MKNYLLLLIIVAFYSCKNETSSKSETAKKPNIVFVLVDDLGYADVGFNGSKYFETPTLDALAKESLVLDNTYMYPTCSPSRTAIFTGKQSFRTGVYSSSIGKRNSRRQYFFTLDSW